MKAFELAEKINELMRKDGMGGRPVMVVVGHSEGLWIEDVRWNDETKCFEIHA